MAVTSLFDQLIDQYKLERHIAQKACTDLYLATDGENRTVALEILLPNFAENREFAQQFMAKMKTVSQLRHPQIAQVLQVGITPNKRPYIVREYLEDYSLAERLEQLARRNSPITPIYALQLIRQIAEALALAERLEVYHYDLSAENVMLTLEGNVVLVDLGIPVLSGRASSPPTNSHGVIVDHLSPEQRQGKMIDSRSNVYSLGIMLYKMLGGDEHIAPNTYWGNIKDTLTLNASFLKQIPQEISNETYNLINKCVQKYPRMRYRNIEELIEAIDIALVAEQVRFHNGTGIATVPTRTSRPWYYVPLLLLLLFTCLGGGLLIRQIAQTNGSNNRVPGQVEVNGTSSATSLPQVNVSPTASATPTGTPISQDNEIIVLQPPPAEPFTLDDTIIFSWTWPVELEEAQHFAVYIEVDGSQDLVGNVMEANEETIYVLEVPVTTFTTAAGTYQWHVALENSSSNTTLFTSELHEITVLPPPTATVTPSPTHTPSPTATPTTIPTETTTDTPTLTATAIRQLPTSTPTPLPPSATPIPPTATNQPPPPPPPTSPPPPPPPPTSPPPSPTNEPPPTSEPPTSTPPPPQEATATPPSPGG